MDDIKMELLEFLERISNDGSIVDTINDLRLGFICDEELPFGKEKISILAHRFNQEKINHIYLNELEKIYELCSEEKPLVFKGIAHSYSFYKEPNVRFFNDIDLFIRESNCKKITEILEDLGYKKRVINNRNNRDLFFIGDLYADYAIQEENHISNYIRNHQGFEKIVDGVKIDIELHIYMFSPLRYPFIDYNEIYERYRKLKISDDKSIYTLSIEDTLICASCHMAKHIVDAIAKPDEMRNHIDMKAIIDIKALLKLNHISWVDVLKMAHRWKVVATLLLSLKLVNYVFPYTVSDGVLNMLKSKISNTSEKHSHESLIREIAYLKSEDIFFFNLDEFFEKETIDKSAPCYIASKIQSDSTRFELEFFDESFLLQPYWDEEYFMLYSKYNERIKNMILSLTIGSHISYLHAQTFFADIMTDNMKLSNSYTNEEEKRFSRLSLKEIKFAKTRESIVFKIPWKNLNIVPFENYIMPFNLKILIFDNNTNHLKYIKSLTKNNYYNDYGTHSICLK